MSDVRGEQIKNVWNLNVADWFKADKICTDISAVVSTVLYIFGNYYCVSFYTYCSKIHIRTSYFSLLYLYFLILKSDSDIDIDTKILDNNSKSFVNNSNLYLLIINQAGYIVYWGCEKSVTKKYTKICKPESVFYLSTRRLCFHPCPVCGFLCWFIYLLVGLQEGRHSTDFHQTLWRLGLGPEKNLIHFNQSNIMHIGLFSWMLF